VAIQARPRLRGFLQWIMRTSQKGRGLGRNPLNMRDVRRA
jgi:hypothetical protein